MWLIDPSPNIKGGPVWTPPSLSINMGNNKGFSKWARQHVTPLTAPVEGHLWVDMSILLYKWNRSHPQLAMDLFGLDANQALSRADILASITAYVSGQIRLFKQGQHDVTLVLEGHTPKPRHVTLGSRKAKRMNNAIRSMFFFFLLLLIHWLQVSLNLFFLN